MESETKLLLAPSPLKQQKSDYSLSHIHLLHHTNTSAMNNKNELIGALYVYVLKNNRPENHVCQSGYKILYGTGTLS